MNKLKKQTKAPHGNGSSESISVGYDLKKLEQMHPNEFWYDKKKNDSASCRKQKKEQILAAATATLLRTNAEETSIRQKRSMQTIPNVHLDDIPTTLCEDHAKLGTIRNRNRRLKINKNF